VSLLEKIKNRLLFLMEIWDYLKVRKKWWLLPLLLMLFFVGLLIFFGQSTALSPFIYALF
jgi:hypothetical protein